jgi:predicted DNA-binding protein (MmcQ/YjbR family)
MAENDAPTKKLRAICLAFPEAVEKETWGDPTFRIRNKIFAMEKRGDGRISVWCKSTPDARDALLLAAPSLFFIPPYVGSKGWIGMRLDDDPDWQGVVSVVRESYRLIAPRKLARLVEP